MKTSSTVVFFGTIALTGAIVVGSSLEGCRSSGGTGDNGGSATTSSTMTTGTGGVASDAPVAATVVTIPQLTNPNDPNHVGSATPVTVQGAVVMSPKFLVSKSASGSCLWGVFLSAPTITETAAYSGILALSYGTPASVTDGGTKAYCPVYQAGQPAGDSFPDTIAPGDVIDVTGVSDSYIYAGCSAPDAGVGASTVASYQLNKVTNVVVHSGTATLPTPYKLTSSDISSLAAATDTSWLAQWGNVRVEADDVTLIAQSGALTDAYGHMLVQAPPNGIQVGDSVYYVGYVKSTDACYAGPTYPTTELPLTLNSLTGFVYLDYCNWGLQPSSKCSDLNPQSPDCLNAVITADSDAGSTASDDGGDAGVADAAPIPTDASADPSQVCTH